MDFPTFFGRFTHIGGLLPTTCHLCDLSCQGILCTQCQSDLPCNDGSRCQRCDVPVKTGAPLCGPCTKHPPNFDSVITAWRFEPPVDLWVRKTKEKHEHFWLPYLSDALISRISQTDSLPQALIPVPMHWLKRLRRGYNQSELLAHHLGKKLNLPVASPVRKIVNNQAQKYLSRKERLKNLRHSFQINAPIPFEHVTIVDDVVTTGATVDTLARLLKKNGVKSVDVWALARTPQPD